MTEILFWFDHSHDPHRHKFNMRWTKECRMTLSKLWFLHVQTGRVVSASRETSDSDKAWGTVAICHIEHVCRAIRSDTIKLPNSFQHTHPTQSWLHCWGLIIDIQTLAAINHAQTASWTECIMWFHDIHPETTAWKDRTIPTKWNRISVEEQWSPADSINPVHFIDWGEESGSAASWMPQRCRNDSDVFVKKKIEGIPFKSSSISDIVSVYCLTTFLDSCDIYSV